MQESNYDHPPPNYPPSNHATNTFSQSPSFPQIFSYIAILSEIIVYYVCIHQIIHNWYLFAAYTASTVLMVLSAVLVSCSNPTDKVVYRYKWGKYKKEQINQIIINHYFCEYCDSYCKQTSKHCKKCNRCVNKFDHHCVWINNCIGQQNYWGFFFMILLTFSHIVLFLISGGIMTNSASIMEHELSKTVPVWIIMAIFAILGIMLFNLIVLHIYLQCIGMTTYQLLVEKKRKNQKQQQIQRQQQNQSQINNRIQVRAKINSHQENKPESNKQEDNRGQLNREDENESQFESSISLRREELGAVRKKAVLVRKSTMNRTA